MFEKFGEFESYEEINKAAEGFLQEGDIESLKAMAKENGLDDMDTEDYINGDVSKLCNERQAAVGRLSVEKAECKADRDIMRVIFMIAESMANTGDNPGMFITKGKRLEGIVQEMRDEAAKNKKDGIGVVCGTDLELVKRIREYYGRQ